MKKLFLMMLLCVTVIFSACQQEAVESEDTVSEKTEVTEKESTEVVNLKEEWMKDYDENPDTVKTKIQKELNGEYTKDALLALSEIFYREGDISGLQNLMDAYEPDEWRDYGAALHFLNELDPFVAQDYLYNRRDDMTIAQWARFTEHVGYADIEDLKQLMEGRELSRTDQLWAIYLGFHLGEYDFIAKQLDEEVSMAADYAWEEVKGWEDVRYRTIVDNHHNLLNVLAMAKNDMGRLLIQNGLTGEIIEEIDYPTSKYIELYVEESPDGIEIVVENCVDFRNRIFTNEVYFYQWDNEELTLTHSLANPVIDFKSQIVPDFNLVFSSTMLGKTVFQPVDDEADELVDRGFYYDDGQTAVSEVHAIPVYQYDPYLGEAVATVKFVAFNPYSEEDYYFAENYLKLNYEEDTWQFSLLNPRQEAYEYDEVAVNEKLSNIDDEFIATIQTMNVHEMLSHYGAPDEMMYYDGGLFYIYDSYVGIAYYYDEVTGISVDKQSALYGHDLPMTREEIFTHFPNAEAIYAEYDDMEYIYVDFGSYFAAFSDYMQIDEYTCIIYLKPLGT